MASERTEFSYYVAKMGDGSHTLKEIQRVQRHFRFGRFDEWPFPALKNILDTAVNNHRNPDEKPPLDIGEDNYLFCLEQHSSPNGYSRVVGLLYGEGRDQQADGAYHQVQLGTWVDRPMLNLAMLATTTAYRDQLVRNALVEVSPEVTEQRFGIPVVGATVVTNFLEPGLETTYQQLQAALTGAAA